MKRPAFAVILNAPAPAAGEATTKSSPGTADSFSAPTTIPVPLSRPSSRWRTVARQWLDTFAAECRDIFGPVEFSVAVHRRGYLTEDSLCKVCLSDVHDIGEMCSLQKAGDCSACGQRILLDYYGCPSGRPTHKLANILPATASEWKRRHQMRPSRSRPPQTKAAHVAAPAFNPSEVPMTKN